MSTIDDLRMAIERLDEALQHSSSNTESPGSRLTRRGLDLHRMHLEERLALARRSELEVHLEGAPVTDHEIRIDTLARFLAALQESVSSIVQAMTGRVTARAPLPINIRELSGLTLAGVFAGSFGATLRGPIAQPDENSLFRLDDDAPSILDNALGEALRVMDASSEDDGSGEDVIVGLVAPLGARAFGHLKRLSQYMADEQLSAEFIWTGVGASRPQASRLTARGARRLNDILSHNAATEESIDLVGLLGTASEIRNMIELRLASGDIISARVIDDVVPDLRTFYGETVAATFNVMSVVSTTTGIERRTYTLVSLTAVND